MVELNLEIISFALTCTLETLFFIWLVLTLLVKMVLLNVSIVMSQKQVLPSCFMLMCQSRCESRLSLLLFFLINRLSSPSLDGKTPYELLFGKPPYYSMLRTFRCLCFPYLRDYLPHKLSSKYASCIFLGYSTLHKGFCYLDWKTHHVYVSRHVQFYEHHFPYTNGSFHTLQSSTDYTHFFWLWGLYF
jgi:hypothetical protein